MKGFSLIELLTVTAIIVLLMVLTVPAFQSITQGTALTRGGQMVADQFALARQLAVSRNSQVQMRLVWLTNEPAGYNGIQLWGQGTNFSTFVPLTRMALLPTGATLSSNTQLSPLLTDATLTTLRTNGAFPGHGILDYRGFRFKPGGGTDLPFNATNAFLTIVSARDAGTGSLPPNYSIIQVDPLSGRVKTYRP